jgi:uncharacterized protein involved in exopolysaccharide biosynthesis
VQKSELKSDQVALPVLVKSLNRYKWIGLLWLILSVGATVVYVLTLPNLYKSQATLIPTETSSKLGGLSGALGSVSSLAGINLGSGGEKKSVVALELMKSRAFFAAFMQKYQLKTTLMAANGWDPATNELTFDADIYDVTRQQWVRPAIGLRKAEPSEQECFEAFMRMFGTAQDKLTGVVTVSLEFVSPELAQKWLRLYIDEVNVQMKQRDITEANESIQFIEERIAQTNLQEVRNVLFAMLEEHQKTLVVANVKPEYVFKLIDPPSLPDIKSGPMRSIIVLVALVGAFFIFVVFVLALVLLQNHLQLKSEKE